MFSIKSLVARTFARSATPTAAVKRSRRALALESLESREVPADLLWTAQSATNLWAGNNANWTVTADDVPANVGTHRRPVPGDNVYFGYAPGSSLGGSNFDCESFGSDGTYYTYYSGFVSLNVLGTYSGAIKMPKPLTIGTFAMKSADAKTDNYTDLTVTDIFDWTAGTIGRYVGSQGVTLHLKGAVATVDPDDGTVDTGFTHSYEDGATGKYLPGAVNHTAGRGVIVNSLCSVTVQPPATPPAQRQPRPAKWTAEGYVGQRNDVQILLKAGSSLTVQAGDFESDLGLNIKGGTFTVLSDSTAKFVGKAPTNNLDLGSIAMTDGRIAITHGAKVEALHGVYLTKGTAATSKAELVTLFDPAVSTNAQGAVRPATIVGNVVNTGADVVILSNLQNRRVNTSAVFGSLAVQGNVEWSGGTYRPVVYADGSSLDSADVWLSTGTFTVKQGANLAPGTVDSTGAPNTQQPKTDFRWRIIRSATQLIVQAAPTVSGNWTLLLPAPAGGGVLQELQIVGK